MCMLCIKILGADDVSVSSLSFRCIFTRVLSPLMCSNFGSVSQGELRRTSSLLWYSAQNRCHGTTVIASISLTSLVILEISDHYVTREKQLTKTLLWCLTFRLHQTMYFVLDHNNSAWLYRIEIYIRSCSHQTASIEHVLSVIGIYMYVRR